MMGCLWCLGEERGRYRHWDGEKGKGGLFWGWFRMRDEYHCIARMEFQSPAWITRCHGIMICVDR